jgi:hypothetical protein
MDEQRAGEWFPKGSRILAAGSYRAVLKMVNPGIGKGYAKGQDQRQTLMFSFQEEGQGAVINRTVSRTNSEKSQLVTLIRSMTGVNAPSLPQIQDPDAFKDFILSLVGKAFLIQVEPSKDGRFNNLIGCFPTTEQK